MNLNQALELINTSSPELLQGIPKDALMYIVMDLTPEEREQFFFAKNLKIFGTIDNYANDLFNKHTPERIHDMPPGYAKENAKAGMRKILNTMLTYPELSITNRQRIQQALSNACMAAAAAAGGKYESLPKKLCSCIKKVKKTYKNKNEGRAIAICVKSVLQTKGKTLKTFSCRNEPKLETQPFIHAKGRLA